MWDIVYEKLFERERPKYESKGFRANNNHITRFSVKPNNVEIPEETLTPAFETLLYEKLCKNLQSPLAVLRKKSTLTLRDLFCQSKKHIIRAVQFGCARGLLELSSSEQDETIVEIALDTVSEMAQRHSFARIALIEDETFLDTILGLVRSGNHAIARNALRCLRFVGIEKKGAEVLRDSCISSILNRIESSPDASVKVEAGQALKASLNAKDAHLEALKNDGIYVLTQVLSKESISYSEEYGEVELFSIVTECLAFIAYHPEGREVAIDVGTVTALCNLLSYDNSQVQEYALNALMFFVVHIPAKYQAHDANIVDKLLPLIQKTESASVTMIINLLKVIRNLCDCPEVRQDMRKLLHWVKKELPTNEIHGDLLKESQQKAIQAIEWSP